MPKRSVLLCVPAVVAGLFAAGGSAAGGVIPSERTLVPVTATAVVAGVDAHLLGAGSIEGTLTAVAGGEITATVFAYADGKSVGFGFTDGGGHYLIGGLPSGNYDVCVAGVFIANGNSTTGYLGRCYTSASFNGRTVPAAATEVAVNAGAVTSGIDITFPSAAAISGKIINSSGSGIGQVDVAVKNRSTGAIFHGFTAANGAYKASGLTASATGYAVCANPAFSTVGATGYRPRCFHDVAWNAGAIPSGADPVSVTPGHTHTSVNITLPRGAAVAGQVTNLGGHPLPGARVGVYSATGKALGFAATNAQGRYIVKGLAASTSNRVCASPVATSPTVSYKGECFKNIAWNGRTMPAGTTSVRTTIGHTHTGIGFALTKVTVHLGSISGTITESVGDNPLEDATVLLFSSTGEDIDRTSTDASGFYQFTQLKPNATGYRVCAQADTTTFAPDLESQPPAGWAPRCYPDVGWNGTAPAPTGATKIPISAGQNKTGVAIALPSGGGVSGTTFDSAGPGTVGGVVVLVYAPGGTLLGTATSSSLNGTYSVVDLRPSATGYAVCFDGRNAAFGEAGYLPQCWQDQPWDGNP